MNQMTYIVCSNAYPTSTGAPIVPGSTQSYGMSTSVVVGPTAPGHPTTSTAAPYATGAAAKVGGAFGGVVAAAAAAVMLL